MKKQFKCLTTCFLLVFAIFVILPTHISAASSEPKVGTTANVVWKKASRSKSYVYRNDVLKSYTRVNDKNTQDITTTWAHSDNYTTNTSKSKSVSAQGSIDKKTISGFGLSYSTSTSKGVSTSIPVDSSKWSKLALRADFYKITYTRYWYNSSGKVTSSKEYTTYTPIPGTAEYYIKYK